MPNETATQDGQQQEQPKFPPGIIAPEEVFDSPPVTLSEDEKGIIKSLVQKVGQRDLAAWRGEIIDAWGQRLFDRGYQHLLWSNSFGWTLPAPGTGYHPTDSGSRSMFEANIFSSYEEMIIGALSREFPSPRFAPNDEQNDVDVTAADAAEKLKKSIERNIGSRVFIRDLDRLLCTDGRVICETNYTKDAQKFGYEPAPEGVVPEDATVPVGAQGGEAPQAGGVEPDQSQSTGMGETGAAPPQPAQPRTPRGRETIELLGALEAKCPMKAGCIGECDYVQTNKEIPISVSRAKFPEVAKQITAATAGPGGDNIARLARVNVKLGVENNFVTTDSTAYDVTEQRSWFRPSIFYDPDVPEDKRDGLLDKFPLGLRVVYMGETFCEARNIGMDDHLTLIHARAGDGMHRASLLKWLLPIQKVFNHLLDLYNDYLTRGIPMKWFPTGPFSREKIASQTNTPGGFDFYVPDPALPDIRNAIFVEEILPFPEQLVAILQWLPNELAQMLTGCFPALFGGDSGSQGVGDALMQRDQALGRLGPVWGRIKEGLSNCMRQAVQCLARSGQDVIKTVGKESIAIETTDLKGNIHCFPETDENFPSTWLQKQARLEQIVELAIANPMFLQIVDDPNNLETLKNAFGFT